MARSKRKSKQHRGKKAGRTSSEHDWSEYLGDNALKMLEALPLIGHVLSTFREDPSEENLAKIAKKMEDLIQQDGLLDTIRMLLEESISKQNTLLDSLKDLMDTYQRPDLFGQLSAYSILGEAVRQIKRLADQAEHIAGSLKGIDENIRSVNVRGNYFPVHIHSYVRMEIEKHASDTVPHYFTVFNKGSQWHPKFADLQRSNPLGPLYLGHKTDLDELCAFLAEEAFHFS
ncbi:hypothetical protein S40293_05960 [Stachybotrys chartarum IBT 40293]|nr:hypothetical protein S40293_05960 [Stachybotrys chartarum IBT 40293]